KKCIPIYIKLSADDLAFVKEQQEVFLETSNLDTDHNSKNDNRKQNCRCVKSYNSLPIPSSDEDSDSLPSAKFVSNLTTTISSNRAEEKQSTSNEILVQENVISDNVPIISGIEKLILEKLEALSRKIDNLDFHIQALTPIQNLNPDEINSCPELPATNIQQLLECDAFCISSVANAKKRAVLISRVGGRNVKEATENVLGELMTDAVAVEYNWAGMKRGENQKLAFKNTRLVALTHDSIKLMRHHSRVERSEIEDPVKVWLKNASARIKRCKNSSLDTADEVLND
ncbi:unnamed protein product, partial [Allacma fusca]